MSDASLSHILERASETPKVLTPAELARLVALTDDDARRALYAAAYELKCRYCGHSVSLRGLIELGNICSKDCFYCGIRKSNTKVARYQLTAEDVARLARVNVAADCASVVLQSGEIESEAHTAFIEDCLRRMTAVTAPGVEPPGITLSLGEQTEEVYRRWKEAGALRYLLRIETSNPDLYARIHPKTHSWTRRVACLRALRRCGYQVGTGVMSGLPGQTAEDLARDIVFFGEQDVDMIGMGPYIPHQDTPLGRSAPVQPAAERLRIGLNMIAATRLYLHDVNIAATTALQTLDEKGRELGVLAGANVMMPNITDTKYRRRYQLYEGKPSLDENAESSQTHLARSLAAIGEQINYGRRGDSAHFFARMKQSLPEQD